MNFWLLITELGDEKAYLVFVPFVYFVVDRRTGWQLFCALILSSLTVITLKNFFKLPRPPKYLWKTSVSGYGFPSGHTTVSATFWSYLAFKIRKVWFFAVAFAVVGLVGLSRIFLGVHYVRDVIGGLIIGISIGYVASSIEFSLNRSSKLLGIVISSLLIFSLYPLIGHYAFKIGGYLLGFGVAHTHLIYGLPKLRTSRQLKAQIRYVPNRLVDTAFRFYHQPTDSVSDLGIFWMHNTELHRLEVSK